MNDDKSMRAVLELVTVLMQRRALNARMDAMLIRLQAVSDRNAMLDSVTTLLPRIASADRAWIQSITAVADQLEAALVEAGV